MCKKNKKFKIQKFSKTNFHISPYTVGGEKKPSHTLLRSVASLPRFSGPPLTNPGCTTVTGVARGHKRPCPLPVDWSKRIFFKGRVGDWYMPLQIAYPHAIMAFNVQVNAVFIHTFSKKISLPEGETHPLPARSLPRFDPVNKSLLHHALSLA